MRSGSITLRPILIVFASIAAFLTVMNFAITAPKSTVNSNIVACTRDAKICPDGSSVGRSGPNCEFDPCLEINDIVNANVSANLPSGKPVVIYALYKDTVIGGEQQWSVVDIISVVDNGAPTLLATIGKVNEAPQEYILSPDRKWLAIDVLDRAIIINLATNKIEKSFTPARDISGIVFSQDSKKVLIWDQKDGDDDKTYTVHSITLATMEDVVVGRGKTDQAFYAAAWRSDEYVVLMHYYYPTGSIHLYNPTTNKITQTEDVSSLTNLLSPSGRLYSLVSASVNDVCNEYSGSAFSGYTIKDTKTAQLKGQFGDGVLANSFIAFSPDDKEVLFSSTSIPTKYEQCSTGQVTTYFRQKLGGQPVKVNNYDAVLEEWGQKRVAITTERIGAVNSNQTRILVNGQDWNIPENTTIVKSFYTK